MYIDNREVKYGFKASMGRRKTEEINLLDSVTTTAHSAGFGAVS